MAIFVHAVIAGMVVYGTYTLLRVIRRIIRHNLISVSIEDFLFWVGTSFYLFIEIYYTSDGSVRWFFILGVVLGMVFLSFLIFLTKKICEKIKKSVDKRAKTR
ncbi:MAG: spore cortex biosynthesis protein YabQ [Lachnospiraceae bacterium]|nr:spore cortex biosynthesis protein YabQ [Lachnospiraceae bacterium]